MRPPLSKRSHLPHETRSIFQGRQFNAWPTRGFDDARQLKPEIMLLGLRHSPSYCIEI
jgi:hypothetical protein